MGSPGPLYQAVSGTGINGGGPGVAQPLLGPVLPLGAWHPPLPLWGLLTVGVPSQDPPQYHQ